MNFQDSSITQIRNYIEQLFSKGSYIADHADRYRVLNDIVSHLKNDKRKEAQRLIKYANHIMKLYSHWRKMLVYESELYKNGYNLIAGIDEVGRGPLAGPVVSASVVLDHSIFLPDINDSKKLSESQRELLYNEITQKAISIGIGVVEVEIIDNINILNASLESMRQAVNAMSIQPDFALVDGQHCPKLNLPMKPIIGGDSLSLSIASASIIAKVTRDHIMNDLDKIYPQYKFSCNKGYPTPDHLSALEKFGPCKVHRKSFAPVAEKIHQIKFC